jgi:phage minor structural protein
MIPILYDNKETSFSSLGLGVLKDATSAIVTEERNGVFELELKYSVDGKLFNELKNDRYIKVDANPNSKDQLFRIIRVDKPIKGEVTVYAEHVSYLSRDVALNPVVSYNGNAGSALNTWLDNLIDATTFSVFSDILTVKSGTWNIEDYQNARNVLGGKQGSILQNYGGEYQFDNYHIMLWNQRGKNRGVPIVYGKNIIDLNQEEEINSTYTSIYPYRVYEDENGNKIRITLTEKYIDGDYVNNYGHRKIKTVAFDDESITSEQALRDRATQYVQDNNIGLPKVNITVNFIDLASTLNYKDRAVVEQIDLCDTLPIIYDKIGIETKAKIVKVTYDALRDRYETLEFGSIKSNLSQTITETVTQETERLDKEIEYVQISANGKNKIFRRETEPTEGMTENDLWYKPVGAGETELYRFTGTMWSLEKVSAGLLGGTLDAGSGDLDVINLNASSIVTGTLDASLVNVINLNANNIISGTIDANMINATTLSAITANLGTINAGTINGVQVNSANIAITEDIKVGKNIYLGDMTTFSELKMVRFNNSANITGGRGFAGAGIAINSDELYLGALEIYFEGGSTVQFFSQTDTQRNLNFSGHLTINVSGQTNLSNTTINGSTPWTDGNDGSGSGLSADDVDGLHAHQFLRSDTSDSTSGSLTVGGSLTTDSGLVVGSGLTINGGTIRSVPTYNYTTSLASNMHIASSGLVYRSTSASKYKGDIQPITRDFNDVLSLTPKSWWDKAELAENNGDTTGLWRHHGLIAEDLVNAGLDEMVIWYDGQPEGIQYERLAVYLIPIVRKLTQRVEELERVIK